MSTIPTPRSRSQILGDMLDAFLSRLGLKGIRAGSPVLSLFEAAAQSDLRSSQDIFNLLNSQDLAKSKGRALDQIGADETTPRLAEAAASGLVTVTDTSFTKKATKIYQGLPPPIVGSVTVYVVDALSFPSSGNIYLGRGTANYEGPLHYSAKANNGTYWTLTLTDSSRRFHNLGESVVLAQGGDRSVNAGTLVQTPQGNTQDAIKFSVLYSATVPDGETEIVGVQVVAQKPGTVGNVPAQGINSFVTAPFTGASATNPLPFNNGLPAEDDDTYRDRIRSVRASRAKGTKLALKIGVQGITATDENKRITSASVVVRKGYPTTLYIDDGTGYEEKSEGIAIESIVDSAFGGEQYLRIGAARPVAKASATGIATAPFALAAGMRLSVRVGGIVTEHVFDSNSFRDIGAASAYEVVASINSNPLLNFNAHTGAAGTEVVIFGKNDTNEDVEVVAPDAGVDANTVLLFPSGRVDSLRLYRNDRLLSKDGVVAQVSALASSQWSTLSNGETLTLAVDQTAAVTYTFTDSDFVDAGTGFNTVATNTVAAWAQVLNRKIPGVTATVSNGIIVLTSNKGADDDSAITISGGTLVSKKMFGAGSGTGQGSDYTLDRNTGEIQLETVLGLGERVSAGTANTRAFLESLTIPTTNLAGDGHAWFVVDGDAGLIRTGVIAGLPLQFTVASTQPWGFRVRLASAAALALFGNVRVGDWCIIFDSASPIQGQFRVMASTSTYVEIARPQMLGARSSFTATKLADGRVLVCGGFTSGIRTGLGGTYTNTAEIFDPATSKWSTTGSMTWARSGHTATLLNNGQVLVCGGVAGSYSTSAELFDPAHGSWVVAASMATARQGHAAALLSGSGKVLVAGGNNNTGNLLSAELFDPGTGLWTAAASMSVRRASAMATAFNANQVLVAGGLGLTVSQDSAEYYDGNLNTWTAVTNVMATARTQGQSLLLGNGKVLVIGGYDATATSTNSASLYDPGANSFSAATGTFGTARLGFYSALMSNGKVLVTGGRDSGLNLLADASVYDPTPNSWSAAAGTLATARAFGLGIGTSAGALIISGIIAAAVPGTTAHTAISELTTAGASFSVPPGFSVTSWTPATGGIVFARTLNQLQKVTVPAASNYTATSFTSSLNSQISGMAASVYQTTAIRINTNTYASGGDIALVAADTEGVKLKITPASATENSSSHLASIESGNVETGTPYFSVFGAAGGAPAQALLQGNIGAVSPRSFVYAVGMGDVWDYISGLATSRYGTNRRFHSPVIDKVSVGTADSFLWDLRVPVQNEILWQSRFYLANPFAMGPADDLTVVVDQDPTTKRYLLPFYRRGKPSGSYAATVTVKDADNAGATLAQAFGIGFDFSDFALYMASRSISHGADATKSVLWRYTRPGPDGDSARVRYVYPKTQATGVQVTVDSLTNAYTSISVGLASDVLKTGYGIRAATKIGMVLGNFFSNSFKAIVVASLPVATITRTIKIAYTGRGVAAFTGTLTGGTSGATATVVSDSLAGGSTGPGTLVLGNVTGGFGVGYTSGETITGTTGSATANGGQFGDTVATLTVPSIGGGDLINVTSHGFVAGNQVWMQSLDGNFTSSLVAVTATSSSGGGITDQIKWVTVAAQAMTNATVANAGSISFDGAEAVFSGASPAPVAATDIIRIEGTATTPVTDLTLQIASLSSFNWANGHFFDDRARALTTGTVIVWGALGDAPSLKIYALDSAKNTAAAIATTVKALATAENSMAPVTAKILGAGSGVIGQASFKELAVNDPWYYLSDGVNYIKSVTYPGDITQDYQFTLKDGIASGLAGSGSDWVNEDVRLVPLTVAAMVRWLNAPAVTGISSVCSVAASSGGNRLQVAGLTPGSLGSVQVQGGTANSAAAAVIGAATQTGQAGGVGPDTGYCVATTAKANSAGFSAGSWVALNNTFSMPKSGTMDASTIVSSISAAGTWVLGGGGTSCWSYSQGSAMAQFLWQVEKTGAFTCFSLNPAPAASLPAMTSIHEGDWVWVSTRITPTAEPALTALNFGIFRVVRVDTSSRSFWIENKNSVEEVGEANIQFFTANSLMPGDSINISTSMLGAGNVGKWVIESVGKGSAGTDPDFNDRFSFKVATSAKLMQVYAGAAALGVAAALVEIVEASPGRWIKRVAAIAPDQVLATAVSMKFDSFYGYGEISEAAGTIVNALDKLEFPTATAVGIDGYRHSIGLIGEANRVIYGDSRDPATYPGIVAEGSNVNISGPLIKRIVLALSLRIRSGFSVSDIADRVRSAVASVINRAGIGDPIAISDIVAAATRVNGVLAVSILSPAFSAVSDLIPVQPYEKAMVLNLEQDVLVSFAGN